MSKGGYDRSRFPTLTDEDYEEIKCGICLGVLNKPLVTQCCQQSYCSHCINEWLKNSKTCVNCRKGLTKTKLYCAPRFCVNLIEKLDIACDYKEFGCDLVLKLGQLDQHFSLCPFNPENKCLYCDQIKGLGHDCSQKLKEINVSLKSENDSLVKVINELKAQNDCLTKSNTKLKASLRRSKSKLSDSEKRFAEELKNKCDQNERMCSRICELEVQIHDLVKEKNQFEEQNRNFFAENQKFKNENKDLRNHCDNFLNQREVYDKNMSTLEQQLEKVKKENKLINEQMSNTLLELNKYKEQNEELRKHQAFDQQHMTEVIKSARDNSNNYQIIRSKLSKISQQMAIRRMIEAVNKFDSFKDISVNLRTEIEAIRRGVFWNTIVYSNDCCFSLNYTNEDVIDVCFGRLRIKLISV